MKSLRWMLLSLCLASTALCAQQTAPLFATAASTQPRKPETKTVSVPPSSFTVNDVTLSPYKPVFQGVSEATLTVPGKHASVGYVLRVDLRAPGISFVTTQHAGAKETISETTKDFAEQDHLQAAINAGFFTPCCSKKPEAKNILGLMLSNGAVVAPLSADQNRRDALLITKDNHAVIEPVTPQTNLSSFYTAVTGSAEIVRDGKNTGNVNLLNGAALANPRTLVGLSRDRRYLYIVAIDGRKPGYSIGTTNTESATILLALHAWKGLNLDGGGSTTMVLENKTGEVVDLNHPSGGTDRWVAASLGLRALPLKAVQNQIPPQSNRSLPP